CRCGRLHAGAGAVIKRAAHGIAIDHHRVHHAIDVGDQTVGGDQRRMHTQLDTCFGASRHTQVLDAITQRLGVIHIRRGQLRNAFGVGLVELQRNTERNGRKDGQFVCGIDAFDVEGRIGLGITQLLGFLEHVLKGATLLAHLGEDEVASAVDDAGQPVDTVARQAFTDCLDYRNAACNRGLEGDDDALFTGPGEDFVTVHGDQRLVCGDHVLTVLDGLEHQLQRQGIATDQLDDNIDIGVADNGENVVGNGDATGVTTWVWLSSRDRHDFDTTPDATGNFLGIALQHIEGSATDGTQPTDANFHRFQAALPIPANGPTQRPNKRVAHYEAHGI